LAGLHEWLYEQLRPEPCQTPVFVAAPDEKPALEPVAASIREAEPRFHGSKRLRPPPSEIAPHAAQQGGGRRRRRELSPVSMECETGLVRSLHGDGLCEPAPAAAAARTDPLNWDRATDPGRELEHRAGGCHGCRRRRGGGRWHGGEGRRSRGLAAAGVPEAVSGGASSRWLGGPRRPATGGPSSRRRGPRRPAARGPGAAGREKERKLEGRTGGESERIRRRGKKENGRGKGKREEKIRRKKYKKKKG